MAEGMVARVGQWCFRRRWWVVAIWVLAVVGGVFAAGPVFRGLTGGGGPSSMESIQANQVLSGNTNMGGMVTAVIDGIDPKAGAVTDTAAAAVGTRLHKLGDALVSAGQTGAQVRVGGGAALGQQVNDAVQKDLARAEEISLPITLVVLVFVFGGLIAAGLPVLAAIVSAASVMTVLLGFATFPDLDNNTVTAVSLLAVGLSIDYGLLLVGRYREELGRGHEPEVAIARAWTTAGRTIFFSALTVAAAMTGLLLTGLTGLSALGAAGVSIALVAMLVSLTFTAAMIGLARRRIKPSKRAARRIARFGDAPLLATSMHLDDVNSFPRSLEAVAVAHELHDRFNVATSPAVVVVARTDPASLDAWATRWTGVAGVSRVAPAEQVGPGLSVVNIDVSGDPEGATARALVDRVRADRPGGG